MSNSNDTLQRFIFDDTDIRGEIVTLETSLHDILSIQTCPENIKSLLGEFLTAVCLLSRTLKFDGALTLQARGNGYVSVIVAEINHHKKIRGTVQLNPGTRADNANTIKDLLGDGILSIIIDPNKGERYQGIVALEGDTLAQCLEAYFFQSEQLPTRLWLHSSSHHAAGLLLQRLPQQNATSEKNTDAWETYTQLTDTITSDELLGLDHEILLLRLFHEDGVRIFDPESVVFSCSCSRARTDNTLKQLGKEELNNILKEDEKIIVDCHFCGFQYLYLQEDIDKMFAPETRH